MEDQDQDRRKGTLILCPHCSFHLDWVCYKEALIGTNVNSALEQTGESKDHNQGKVLTLPPLQTISWV